MPPRVFVSGCFDLLHSGHVAFFEQAARLGDLYVAVGSDRTVFRLKQRVPVMNEHERRYMVQAIGCVKEAFVAGGSGPLDFAAELERLRPDLFVVNEDGDLPEKRALCERLGVAYRVLKRTPHDGLPTRSTTALRSAPRMPYRLDLAGGWLDQPFVSCHHPGPVLTLSLEPTVTFDERSGLATRTRRRAVELWGPNLPVGDPETLAYALFCYDNPPGTAEVSGSQDAVGIVFPGLARAHYAGDYWPERIDHVTDEATLRFVETSLNLLPLGPRHGDYRVLGSMRVDPSASERLARAAGRCWDAALARDAEAFGHAVTASFEAQIAMFPRMVDDDIREAIERHRDRALGWKVSGAGGGGYLVLVSETPVEGAIRVSARRSFD